MQLSHFITYPNVFCSFVLGLLLSLISCVLSYAVHTNFTIFNFINFIATIGFLDLLSFTIAYGFYFIGKKIPNEKMSVTGIYITITVCFVTLFSIVFRILFGLLISFWITLDSYESFTQFLKIYVHNFLYQ